MSSARVLVIEDNPQIGEKLVDVLSRNGFEPRLACDGKHGLDLFAAERPDLVLVEHLVPGMEGGRAVDKLRAVDDEVPIVVMATSPRAQTRLLQLGAGVIQGFLLKPFRVPDLLLALEQALGTRSAAAEGGSVARQGMLGKGGLAPLLFDLVRQGAAGVLRMNKDGVQRALYLLNGLPVFAESNLLSETFGRYLLARGTIHQAQYRAVQKHMSEHGVRQGEALVALGILDQHELYGLLRGQVRERVIRCFDWPDAHFAFYPDDGFIDDKLMFPMNPVALLVEGVSRRRTPAVLQAWFDGARDQPVLPTPVVEELSAYIDRLQRAPVVSEVLGAGRPLGELPAELRLTEIRVAAIVRGLAEIGAVRVGDAPIAAEDTVLPDQPTTPWGRRREPALPDPRYDAEGEPAADPVARAVFARYMAGRGDDHFAALGLGPEADTPAIERAWLETSRDFHPDRFVDHASGEVRERAKEVFLRAGVAFGVLSEPARREATRAELLGRSAARSAAPHARMEAEAAFARGERLLVRDPAAARDAFAEAVRLDPDEPLYEVHLGWATFLSAEDSADRLEAERLIRRGIDRDPAQPTGHDLLSQLCARTGRGGEAAEAAARANHLSAQCSGVFEG